MSNILEFEEYKTRQMLRDRVKDHIAITLLASYDDRPIFIVAYAIENAHNGIDNGKSIEDCVAVAINIINGDEG